MKRVYCFVWLPWTSVGRCHWEEFLEMNLNQKTLKLYTSWVRWKNRCRSTVRKHALLWKKHEHQQFTDNWQLLKISLTHFMALDFFYASWNISENQSFPDVFRGIRRDQCDEWGKSHLSLSYLLCYLFR